MRYKVQNFKLKIEEFDRQKQYRVDTTKYITASDDTIDAIVWRIAEKIFKKSNRVSNYFKQYANRTLITDDEFCVYIEYFEC